MLLGWHFSIPELKNPFPDPAPVPLSSAVLLILCGIATTFQQTDKPWVRFVSRILAYLILISSLLIYLHYLGLQFDLEQIFHSRPLDFEEPGRTPAICAFPFMLLGLALSLNSMHNNDHTVRLIVQFSVVAVFSIALCTLTGYVYDRSSPFTTVADSMPMPFPTAIMFCLISISIILTQPDVGLVAVFKSKNEGGKILRTLLPLVIVVPIIIGWLRLIGQSTGLYDTAFGAAMMTVSLSVVLGGTILWYSNSLNKTDSRKIAAEAQLTNDKRLLESILESLYEGVLVVDADGKLIKYNSTAAKIFGVKPESHDKPIDQLGCYLPDGKTLCSVEELPVVRALRGESIADMELFLKEKGLHVSVSASPLIYDDGTQTGCVVVLRDITGRHQSEQMRAHFAAIVQSSQDAIVSKALDGTVLTWNNAAEKIFGYSAEEMIGKTTAELKPKSSVDEDRLLLEKLKQGNSIDHYESVRRRKNGQIVDVSLSVSPIVNVNGEIVGASEIIREITEKKRMESGLRVARDQAQAASEFKSEFVANMSHEIRTPMNVIMGMCNLLMTTPLNDTQTQYSQHIHEASRSLLTIINDVLDLSKIEAGELDLEIVDFDLLNLVESTCGLQAAYAQEKKISLSTFVEPTTPVLLRGDPDRIRQVLMNLLSNAVKFSENDEVSVSAVIESENNSNINFLFSVKDNGIGLTEEECQKLFKPFVQADIDISRKYGGTGLGLSICKSLVELMGGTIGVKSRRGEGSTFWFRIPLERRSTTPIISSKDDLRDVPVLIVDGHKHASQVLKDYLAAWGMSNGHAQTGAEALQMMQKVCTSGNRYNLVIVDFSMPDIDAFEFALKIQNDSTLSKTKLILTTAFDVQGLGKRAIEAGFLAYLQKPIQQSQLLDCITNVLYGEKPKLRKTVAYDARTTMELRPELCLIVEDHPINQQVALQYVSELGFMCHVVNNGIEALNAMVRNQYSLILMDCHMPILDGFGATIEIRKNETLTGNHIPIVAMTANAMISNQEKCLAAGMDDYLAKPIEPSDLRTMIEKWLPQAERKTNGTESLKTVDANLVAESLLLNVEKLDQRLGKPDSRNLISAFIKMAPSEIQKIKGAAEDRDAKQLCDHAHSFKGACATICAEQLHTMLVDLENFSYELDWEQALTKVNEIENCFTETSEFVGSAFLLEQL